MFGEGLKHSIDRRLPHFSTSIPYVVATVLIMMVPLSVVLSQQETRSRTSAATPRDIIVTVTDRETADAIENAHASLVEKSGECYTGRFGGCSIVDVGSGTFTVNVKADDYDPSSKPVTVGRLDQSATFELIPATNSSNPPAEEPAPDPNKKSYKVNITVRDDQSGKLISGAFVSLDGGSGGGCTTHAEGLCPFTVYAARNYKLHVEKEGYADRDTTISVKSSQTNINIYMVREDSGQPPTDDTRDPNSGGPNDTPDTPDGSNPPGPDELACLGGDCGTPNDCLTPPPSEEEAPEETGGTPSPTDGLRESIIERVQRQITETWNRVLSGLGGNNPNLKPPDFSN